MHGEVKWSDGSHCFVQVSTFCRCWKTLMATSASSQLPAWRLSSLLQLYQAVLELHAVSCALQPRLTQKDWQLPSSGSQTCTLLDLAQCLLQSSNDAPGMLLDAPIFGLDCTSGRYHMSHSIAWLLVHPSHVQDAAVLADSVQNWLNARICTHPSFPD